MPAPFHRIGITGKRYTDAVQAATHTLLRLLNAHGKPALLDTPFAQACGLAAQPHAPLDEVCGACDLLLVVGGDGSVLHAARAAVPSHTAILGIHRGRLGFLTDVCAEVMEEQIPKILEGAYFEEPRALLHLSLHKADGHVTQELALNDVVLHSGMTARMINYNLWVDGHFVCHQRADGLILATPTGSTAYALSGGGPIMHPQLQAWTLVPINPHRLSSRPLVLSNTSVTSLQVFIAEGEQAPLLSCDGHIHHTMHPDDRVQIKHHDTALRLIHPLGYNYYATLRNKLGWLAGQDYVDPT